MGFDLQFMDSTFTSVSLDATGRVIFDDKHFYYADMFVSGRHARQRHNAF